MVHAFTIDVEENNNQFRITMQHTNERPSMYMQQGDWYPSIEAAAANLGKIIPYFLPRMYHMKTKYIQGAAQENRDE